MYSKETLKTKTPQELEEIAKVLGSSLTVADGVDALVDFITNGEESNQLDLFPGFTEETQPQGDAMAEAPKPKRKRRTKAEMEADAARAREEAAKENDKPAEEMTAANTEEEAPKKRRGRKSKAEIEAAAAAAAEALAKSNLIKSQLAIPEEVYTSHEADGDSVAEDTELIEQLNAKLNAHNESVQSETESLETIGVWEGDPGDGTDFIIIRDIPVNDYIDTNSYAPAIQDMYAVGVGHDKTDNKKVAPEQEYDFADLIRVNGVLEVMPDGFGFLRSSDYNYLPSPDDVFLTAQQVKQFSLKTGDVVECSVRPPMEGEKFFTLTSIIQVNGCDPRKVRDRVAFENLTPLFPEEKFTLCGDEKTTNMSVRIVDLFSPIGKGQRSLIVAQPKTGKTMLMKDVANAIAANHPEAYIMMLLIDERPEEVTDMARTVNAEVIASTFDEPAERHVKIAGLVLEKAKRLVECGHDVVIFLDSITRLARAYNTVAPASGKILTGGVDANALQKPKRFFGAARNIEGGGSLTIIATALVDTGSKMDEVIFEEFKGTGNSEIQLDRQLSNKRIFPAVNLVQSSTRRDDLLHDKTTLDRMWILRKHIADMNSIEAMNEIHGRIQRTRSNEEFLVSMNS